ncbi:MAG TPA: flagellar hook-basal body complex protein FliE [Thermodesulfovibrionales bacterium]|jgi:flagellar hook-basal body complex protein FliE|nr:flagellar hook-basal body complex protein FliE [Thermodesulfovibrionales bacterium]
MSDMKIGGLKTGQELSQTRSTSKESGSGFDEIMKETMGKISQVQNDADRAVKDLASGGDVTQAIIAMEKADMSFQLMIEVRNRLLSAYEEITRMQV